MEKLDKFFITTLVVGLVAFSSALVIPTQMVQALIGTNQIADNAITTQKIRDGEVKTPDLATAAVTKEKLNPNAVKLVVIHRESGFKEVEPQTSGRMTAQCNPGEVVTGGGFDIQPGLTLDTSSADGNEWVVFVFNPTDQTRSLRVAVQCAHLELGP